MADSNDLVKVVIEVLHDGQKGYTDIGEHITNPEMRTFFMTESQTRGSYASELSAAAGMSDVGGTAVAAIHRSWGDLKAKLGGGDHTLLETAEQGEDAAKKAYEAALADSSISGSVRSLLQQQQTHILSAHNKVKAFRDSTN